MSTSRATSRPSAVATPAPWNLDRVPDSAPAVRPFLVGASETRNADVTNELVLPSVIAQRSAAAERQGFDRGFAAGERAGLDAVRTRTEGQLARMAEAITELRALRASVLKESEQDIVRLAVAIAERILRRETAADPQALLTMARAASQKLGEADVATILLHPDDFAAVSGSLGERDADGIRVSADPGVARGSCIVQSAFGNIDVGIDAQIREILRGLLGVD